jgi:hypothetical protein
MTRSYRLDGLRVTLFFDPFSPFQLVLRIVCLPVYLAVSQVRVPSSSLDHDANVLLVEYLFLPLARRLAKLGDRSPQARRKMIASRFQDALHLQDRVAKNWASVVCVTLEQGRALRSRNHNVKARGCLRPEPISRRPCLFHSASSGEYVCISTRRRSALNARDIVRDLLLRPRASEGSQADPSLRPRSSVTADHASEQSYESFGLPSNDDHLSKSSRYPARQHRHVTTFSSTSRTASRLLPRVILPRPASDGVVVLVLHRS